MHPYTYIDVCYVYIPARANNRTKNKSHRHATKSSVNTSYRHSTLQYDHTVRPVQHTTYGKRHLFAFYQNTKHTDFMPIDIHRLRLKHQPTTAYAGFVFTIFRSPEHLFRRFELDGFHSGIFDMFSVRSVSRIVAGVVFLVCVQYYMLRLSWHCRTKETRQISAIN